MQGKNLISYPLTRLEKTDFSFGMIKEENDISGFFFFLSFFYIFLSETGSWLCHQDWSTVEQSQLTVALSVLPTSDSRVAGTTGTHHHTQLIFLLWERWGVLLCCPGCSWTPWPHKGLRLHYGHKPACPTNLFLNSITITPHSEEG